MIEKRALLSIEQLNAMDRALFEVRLGAVYEHSPWVAGQAWVARPFACADAVHAAMQRELMAASRARQLALIRAHPQLIGRLAKPQDLTDVLTDILTDVLTEASRREQSSAGLDRCSEAQLTQLRELNRAYLERFGFPFVVAVRGLNTDEIIARMQEQLRGSEETEFHNSLEQIGRIARLRISEIIHDKT